MPCSLQRKLEIARALARKPSLLLLDEPAEGMSPEESLDLAELIHDLHRRFKLTTLLTGHPMDVVLSLCERICVMKSGERTAEGPADETRPAPELLRACRSEGRERAENSQPGCEMRAVPCPS